MKCTLATLKRLMRDGGITRFDPYKTAWRTGWATDWRFIVLLDAKRRASFKGMSDPDTTGKVWTKAKIATVFPVASNAPAIVGEPETIPDDESRWCSTDVTLVRVAEGDRSERIDAKYMDHIRMIHPDAVPYLATGDGMAVTFKVGKTTVAAVVPYENS